MNDQKVTWQKIPDTMLLAQCTRTQRWYNIELILTIMSQLARALLCERSDKQACISHNQWQ